MQNFSSCEKKQEQIKTLFRSYQSKEEVYEKIIDIGRSLPQTMLSQNKTAENLVQGCQSIVYLHCQLDNNKLYFSLFSEALISRGLGALLLMAYNEEAPETLLKCPPSFLKELDIPNSLTPGRSNGLASMFLRMQQDAVKSLSQINSK